MTKRNFTIFAAATLACNQLLALDVTVAEPGSLSSLIDDLATTSLTVNGAINAQDLYFIGDNLTALTSLNIANATIVAYNGDDLKGAAEYAADLIPAGTFAGSKLQDITLPAASPLSIGLAAFAGCNNLKTIALPAGEVGAYAFSDCTGITEVTLADNTTVDEGAFARCTSLKTINGAESLTAISDNTFMGCSSLASFAFGKNLQTIGNCAFSHTSISALDFTNATALSSLGAQAFANNTALQSVIFNDEKAVTLGEGAFFGCTSISKFALPALSEMPDYLLTDNKSISTIELPASVTYIGTNAMTGMQSLKSINAKSLTKVPELGTDVWHNTDQSSATVYTTDALIEGFRNAGQWQDFNFTVSTSVADAITVGEVGIKGRFDGTVLQVIATGADIANITLYNTAGVALASVEPNSDSANINTADFSTQIYIVNATLSNGNIATLKLIRK
jgi:hypothetical protein